MDPDTEEKIVMTPTKSNARNQTCLKIERKRMPCSQTKPNHGGQPKPKVHVAGGSYAGIVINKQQEGNDCDDETTSDLFLEFRVYLKSASTQRYVRERRGVNFWFKDEVRPEEFAGTAQEFFKKLVSPVDFPRDYVGFMKKVMKLMQVEYPTIAKIKLELTQEEELDQLPVKSGDLRSQTKVSQDEDEDGRSSTTSVGQNEILCAIEEAYPNSLTIDDMAGRYKVEKEMVRQLVLELVDRKLVKPVGGAGVPAGLPGTVDTATGAFRRVHNRDEENVTVVKQMPRGGSGSDASLQPTIAIITAHYFEKMAVDAVMTDRKTFVRYATNGEANVYTLGRIGDHQVVSTKLPMTGRTRDALIATGSTTTRLLGTFQAIDKVFLVGVGGAIPHYTDFDKHVRLGDVVISAPSNASKFIYQYYESISSQRDDGKLQFEMKSWCPEDLCLQEIGLDLVQQQSVKMPWTEMFRRTVGTLQGEEIESHWSRPSGESDKLYMSVGGSTLVEVAHPSPMDDQEDPRSRGEPVLHLGPVATGRYVALNDELRQDFASRHGILAFDCELDSVVESIYGSRKDSYMLIRGIADYKDGTKGSKDWQQYSALMAASVLKSIIDEVPPPS